MPFTITRNETSLAEFADRVFRDLSPASLKDAIEAIIKANPRLRDTPRLEPGTVIVVPDVTGLDTSEALDVDVPLTHMSALIQDQLADYSEHLKLANSAQRKDLNARGKQLALKAVKTAISESETLSEIGKVLAESLKNRTQAIDELQKGLNKAFGTLKKELPK